MVKQYKESIKLKIICLAGVFISLIFISEYFLMGLFSLDFMALFWIIEKLDDLEYKKKVGVKE